MAGRRRTDLTMSKVRSAITNGSSVLYDVDHRSATMRRFRDTIQAHQADLGGEPNLSEGQKAIIRRAAMLQLQLEMMEQKFAVRDDGVATGKEIEVYQRASNSLRRLIESLGLHQGRRPRDVTPSLAEYVRSRDAVPTSAEAMP